MYGLGYCVLGSGSATDSDEVRMLTLIRGDVRESTETRLSPTIPTLENAYKASVVAGN